VPEDRAVAVLGLGYAGLPLALAAARAGHDVVGFDVSPARVAELAAGHSPVDDISDEDLLAVTRTGRMRFTGDEALLADRDTYVICVPTPLIDKLPDLSMVEAAIDIVAERLSPGDLVVLESTTYPGTTEELVATRLTKLSGLTAPDEFHLAFSPERVDPGNAHHDVTNTPRVVGGLGPAATTRAVDFYGSFVAHVHPVSSPRVAEMAKLLENTFRHVNIALVNEMAVFSHELDIDLWEAIGAASTKPFGFMPFHPGPGVGGHCIPVDPSYLSWRVRRLGYPFRFVELATEINDHMPHVVATRIAEQLNGVGRALRGSRILVLGVTYKKDIADLRETPAVALVRRLRHQGAQVSFHDPYVERFLVDDEPVPRVDPGQPGTVEEADLVVVHTGHRTYDWPAIVDRAALVFDTRNATSGLDRATIERL
jgi:UDP-N-acetyl-D-glucosamine dehydrogenase